MFPRLIAILALGVGSFGSAAFGQSLAESGADQSEQKTGSYAVETLEMILDRALPSPPPPPGLVENPQPSVAVQASDLAGALLEDATYRVGKTIDPVFGSDLEPEKILDRDWTRVTDVEVAPYKAVCQIETTWNDGTKTLGTAAFVGRRVLVTAGHCVFDPDYGGDGWAQSVRVVPARKSGNKRGEPYGSDVCRRFATTEEWIVSKGKDFQYDIAWLILPSRVLQGRVDFHFDVRAASDSKLTGFNLHSASYPDPQALGYKMYHDFELKDQIVVENYVHHYHDTLGGSSGCPLYLKSGRDYDIVAVHSHTPVDPLGIYNWNTATRMTGENVAKTKLYNQQYP
jgi:V8-like Glu-specific endopeptidase